MSDCVSAAPEIGARAVVDGTTTHDLRTLSPPHLAVLLDALLVEHPEAVAKWMEERLTSGAEIETANMSIIRAACAALGAKDAVTPEFEAAQENADRTEAMAQAMQRGRRHA